MRHRKSLKKISKPTDQRLALLAQLVRELFKHGRIKTTQLRAKEAAKIAEKIVTLAKKGDLNSIRNIAKILRKRNSSKLVLPLVKERYLERSGGYTRIIKIGMRRGDNAAVSFLELV